MTQPFLTTLLTTLALTCIASSVSAQQVQLGQVQLAGSGCPQGSASVTLSPDGSVASILFSAFQITKDNPAPLYQVLQKTCRVILPIQVPANYSLQAWNVDYRGYVHVEDPMVTFAFSSKPGLTAFQHWAFPVQTTYLKGVRDEPLFFTHNIRTLTGCGSRVDLQVEMNMQVSSLQGVHPQPIRGSALATIDSADAYAVDPNHTNGLHFRFALLPCH